MKAMRMRRMRRPRAAAFAARLLRRHRRRLRAHRILDLLLRAATSAPQARILERRESRQVLALTRVSVTRLLAQAPAGQMQRAQAQAAAYPPVASAEFATRDAGLRRVLWTELVERRRRIEAGPAATAAAALRRPVAAPEGAFSLPRLQPELLALAARSAPLPASAPRGVDAERASPRAAQPTAAAAAASPVAVQAERKRPARALGDQDLERLAERVIGSIDRRIAARRERLGRP